MDALWFAAYDLAAKAARYNGLSVAESSQVAISAANAAEAAIKATLKASRAL